ncbi:hypothetical protein [Amycolatopsis nalaikhensis]|uniref:Uncharacterized protein n=1 Tax=Amycolatopsis nalaikhensis TaxID=715472 RepID=A0ABY8XC24_9PSEU|nr:hypothetical protein [Amycolatopsis sp. 2-2]WIV53555.1 hypothetical protein QP939_32290 [Amycolatopsis sp. 2-2]
MVAIQRALQQRVEGHLKGDPEAAGIAAPLSHGGVPVQLPIPVRIWLEDESGSAGVQEAVKNLLDAHGFAVVRAFPAQQGSWRRSLVFRLRRAGSSEEMRRRLEKIERGVELQLLTKNQAQVDQAQGDAVAKLLVALQASSTALVQIGSVLIVKIDGVPLVRNLTQAEIAMLDRDPSLLDNPRSVLNALSDAAAALPETEAGQLAQLKTRDNRPEGG